MTNEAAERLRANINDQPLIRSSRKWWIEDLDAALADERRATVKDLARVISKVRRLDGESHGDYAARIIAKYDVERNPLDAEAER